jgi:hypothetical protein
VEWLPPPLPLPPLLPPPPRRYTDSLRMTPGVVV